MKKRVDFIIKDNQGDKNIIINNEKNNELTFKINSNKNNIEDIEKKYNK